MNALEIVGILALACGLVAAGAFAAYVLKPRTRHTPAPPPRPEAGRILFPFVASALSARALDLALRLARAEDDVLVPVFLARVPLHMPLDSPLPRQSQVAIALQETIEQRAGKFGVAVDARIERGRTNRHALRRTIADERFDRIVVVAAAAEAAGFAPDDVAWLLDHAPGEIIVLRPGPDSPDLAACAAPADAAVYGNGRPASVRRTRTVGAREAKPTLAAR